MRLLLVTEDFDPARGGAERSLAEMAQALARRGVSVEVLANQSPRREPWLHNLAGPPLRSRRGLLAFARQARDFCQAADYDIVHSITPAYGGDLYQPRAGCLPALFEASINRSASTLSRGLGRLALRYNAKRQALLALERELVTSGRALICPVSRSSAQDFEAHYHLGPDRLAIVFNAVALTPLETGERARLRTEQRGAWQVGQEERVMIFVGHDFARKGLATAIKALHLAAIQKLGPWRLVVLGRNHPAAYLRQAARLKVADRIHWIEEADSAARFMLGADLLALPTFFDPCSRVVLEAMVLGLPAATTPQNGASEIIEPGRSGFILRDPFDAPGLVAAMAALQDPERGRTMSHEAQAQAAYLHIDRLAEEVSRLYERLRQKKADRA